MFRKKIRSEEIVVDMDVVNRSAVRSRIKAGGNKGIFIEYPQQSAI